MNLFDECISVLNKNCEVLSQEETSQLIKEFSDIYPITFYGRIDWQKVSLKISIKLLSEIFQSLKMHHKDLTAPIYIFWDSGPFSAVKSSLDIALDNIDDITAVSFDTWIYCPTEGWVIELYHDGEVTLGFEENK